MLIPKAFSEILLVDRIKRASSDTAHALDALCPVNARGLTFLPCNRPHGAAFKTNPALFTCLLVYRKIKQRRAALGHALLLPDMSLVLVAEIQKR
jgi:hypothetical protein